jgi:catechol 2,3-dioxygenase-like lactoylglutathione lyase family enzyme
MMKAKTVSHIAVCVRDLERSLGFYRDILGLTVKVHATQDMAGRSGAQSADMYATPHGSRIVANLYFDGEPGADPFLVLVSHPGDDVGGDPIKLDQIGISHLSFAVDDVAGMLELLESKGVPLAGKREDFTGGQGNIRTIFVYDPDGILVQFDQGNAA